VDVSGNRRQAAYSGKGETSAAPGVLVGMGMNFRKLKAFASCQKLLVEIYSVTRILPHEERFGLVPQMRRAATSCVANIAEGFGRKSQRERARFLGITLGSLNELECYLLVCRELDYLDSEAIVRLREIHSEAAKVVTGLQRSLTHG